MNNISRQASPTGAEQFFVVINRLANLGTQQLLSAIQGSRPLVDAYVAFLKSMTTLPMTTMPALGSAASSLASMVPRIASPISSFSSMTPGTTTCCEIPETPCPPRCVCDIVWEAAVGEHTNATITLTNTAKKAQVFTLAATAFQGPSGDTSITVSISPSSVNLGPNQSATVALGLDVSDKFVAGDSYSAELTVAGQYEQCVRLQLDVLATLGHHCDLQQGDIPTHIRAHRWYDHFQCEEPCFEAASLQRPATTRGKPVSGPG